MRPNTATALEQLHASMPALQPGEELILHPQADHPVALLRRHGSAPEAFGLRDGTWAALAVSEDAKIPGAALLADPAGLAAQLRPLVGAITVMRVVAWRPGRRIMVRLANAAGEAHWLKLLSERGHARAAASFAAVHDSGPLLRLVLPSHGLPDIGGFLFPNAEGVSLNDLVTRDAPPAVGLLADTVRALAATETAPGLPVYEFEEARTATIAMLEKAAGFDPTCAELVARVSAVSAPAPAPAGFVHGDLHDKQLFFTGTSASVIDLEGMAVGDSRFDAINLVEHLRLRDLQQIGIESGLAEVLLAELGIPAAQHSTLVYRAIVRARLCAVYTLRPRWRALAGRLKQEAGELLCRLG